MKLKPSEVELVGKWVTMNNHVLEDETCERIRWLTAHHFRRVASSREWGDWEMLFEDPDDGRLWEQTYPQSEMQGGGPPRLSVVSREQAKAKYQLAASPG